MCASTSPISVSLASVRTDDPGRRMATRRSAPRVLAAALLVIAGALGQAHAGGPEPRWFVVDTWSQKKGLPHNAVTAIRQTKDGYLWIGTLGGVARFDGVRFTVFDESDPTQLRENEVKALAEGTDGSVWIGTYGGGLSRYQGG